LVIRDNQINPNLEFTVKNKKLSVSAGPMQTPTSIPVTKWSEGSISKINIRNRPGALPVPCKLPTAAVQSERAPWVFGGSVSIVTLQRAA
jgi:hypothetical protein